MDAELMWFDQHYSGSSGNLYAVMNKRGDRLLIDPGVTWKKLRQALEFDLKGIRACLLSHEHMDHAKAAKDVMQAGMDVYASQGTLRALKVYGQRRARPVEPGRPFYVDSFYIYPFAVHHDAAAPLGFMVMDTATHRKLLFATDTSHITQRFNLPFNIVAIECSFDRGILLKRVETGNINERLAKRLLMSHCEFSMTKRYLKGFCDLSRCEQIHLLHLSLDNIDAVQARKEIESEFFIETVTV